MPRNAAVVVAAIASGCVFDAPYASGQTTCSDGVCPSGLVCSANRCVTPGQGGSDAGAPIDADADAMHDAHVAALTCADPGELISGSASSGSTQSHSNTVEPMCGGSVMTGADAIYAITIASPQMLHVALIGSNELAAYVLTSCSASSCIGDVFTTSIAAPLVESVGSGTYVVVVDSTVVTDTGSYTLTVTAD